MRPMRPKTPKRAMPRSTETEKDPIGVYCRIRPLDNCKDSICIESKDEKTVILFPPDVTQNTRQLKEIHCSFQHVFNDSASQKEVFDRVAFPLVHDVLNGNNGLLLTYGITSSGKTYTMTGTPNDSGLVPRSLDVIFNSIKNYQAKKYVFKPDRFNSFDIQSSTDACLELSRTPRPRRRENIGEWSNRVSDSTIVEDISTDMLYAVFVSYVEIYNNYIYDLLEESTKNFNSKTLRKDFAYKPYVSGVVESEVGSVEEAMDLFYKGQRKRKVASTALNTESSRSHSVFTIRIVQAPRDIQGVIQDKDQITVSQLNLVDLAGSERQTRTRNTNKKLGEAGNINNSLMVLKACIEALREAQNQEAPKIVPYRDSKLTRLFQTYFEGDGKIRMIVCVNPRADNYDEIIHVLRFAEMTQEVPISRPVSVSTPTVLGFKSGRGRVFRDAIKSAKEQGVPFTEILVPSLYSLGPDFPLLSCDNFVDVAAYSNLIDFLHARIIRKNTFQQDLMGKQEEFRKHLVSMDRENIHLKTENLRLQESLEFREQQIRALEMKLATSEQSNEDLRAQLLEAQTRREQDRIEIHSKNRKISELSKDMEKNAIRMHDKLASEKDRLRRLVERRLAAKQAELEQKMCFTQEKFRQLYKILNADDWDMLGENGPLSPSTSDTTSGISTPEPRRTKRKSAGDPSETEVKFLKAKSATDIAQGRRTTPQSSHPTTSQNDFETLYAKENKAPGSSQRSIAIANLRHRRSRTSSGDLWVEHKPIGNLDLDTLLQPKMKKKISVTKLNVKDVVNKESSRYLLQHQEQDSQGELVTELYKGNIIPSAGGGAQVVFNDVETLQQTSPKGYNLRKRSGESVPLREIEERCATSIECHGLLSRKLKKK